MTDGRYDGIMARLLPFAFLTAVLSIFGLAWIVTEVNPDSASWYIFALLVILIFASVFCLLGLVLYFVRTRFYKRYDPNWYFRTSFKMALYVAFFAALAATLAILQLVTILNIVLAILAVALLAIWSYLGKRSN